jgi:nucleoside-diphosphate-sugar epimerase
VQQDLLLLDVVRIAVQLIKRNKNERFTLISENMSFRDILNAMADGLGLKAYNSHAKPMEILWRLDWFVSNVFNRRKLTQTSAKASYTNTLYSNQKLKRH